MCINLPKVMRSVIGDKVLSLNVVVVRTRLLRCVDLVDKMKDVDRKVDRYMNAVSVLLNSSLK
jgi:hypothetical protein